MTPPLEGVRIVDLTSTIAGATCTMLLADFGAEVIRLTTAAHEARRKTDPRFVALDRGAVRVLLDEEGPGLAARILSEADVVVTAIAADEAVADDDLAATDHPRRITLRLPPSVLIESDLGEVESAGMLGAVLGLSFRQYSTGGVPVEPVYPHALYAQGAWAAVCAVAALIERHESGRGQTVQVAGEQGGLIASFATFGSDPNQQVLPPPGPGGPNPFYTRYQGSDGGWVFLGSLTPKFQLSALETLGLTDLLDDPRIAGNLDATGTGDNRDWVRARFDEAFLARPASEWLELLRAADVPVGDLRRREDWLDHPQMRAIGMRAEFEHPEVGTVVTPGVPLTMSVTSAHPPAAQRTVRGADIPPRPRDEAAGEPSAATDGPLAGVKVLNLGVVLAGPLAGNLLAELGADVLKIEPPAGDPFRDKGFHYNRGMRSLAVDLRDPRGRAAFDELVRRADVVIDNFRSGVLERLRLDHASLTAVNPAISSVSITGFGTVGPLGETPGFDPVLGAMSGMMHAQGGDDDPVMLALAINDVSAGVMATLGTCLAVYAQRSGRSAGQRLSTSLAAASAFAQIGELVEYDGRPPAAVGSADHLGSEPLVRSYRTSDGWVRVHGERVAAADLEAAGLTGDPNALMERLETRFAARTTDEVLRELAGWRVPAVRAVTMFESTADPRALGTELFHPLPKSDGGAMMVPGRLASFSRTPRTERLVPPGLGQHSRELLVENGVDPATVDELIAAGVVIESGPPRITGMPGYR